MTWYNPVLFAATGDAVSASRWLDIVVWGGVLIITGYSMGTLCEHSATRSMSCARPTMAC